MILSLSVCEVNNFSLDYTANSTSFAIENKPEVYEKEKNFKFTMRYILEHDIHKRFIL